LSARNAKAADKLTGGVRRAVTGATVMTSAWGDPATVASMRHQFNRRGIGPDTVHLTSPDGDPYFVLDHSALDGDGILE